MPLAAGTRLGPYEIVAPVGAGGMGEVYKARDTRLERTVAIKTSIRDFSERFQREAHAIASLNHSNICTLHDIGPDYLVMEFVDGKPVQGPLPVDQAIRYAIQIADAVSHAHKHGVVHRDLKPGNILVSKSGVKVLDFGLAKVGQTAAAATAATLTQITQEGMLVGTPRYMAPEQFEGKEADRRSDIFAFGVVLYEMLTGRAAFDGKTQASVMAAIMAAEPVPILALQPSVPPALDQLVRKCLDKDPDSRMQDMHDVLLELRWIAQGRSTDGAAPATRARTALWSATAAVVVAAAMFGGWALTRDKSKPPQPVRFEIPVPDAGAPRLIIPAVSRDGRFMAYAVSAPGAAASQIYIRDLDAPKPRLIPDAQGATCLFWSPDSRYLAFCAGDQVKKLDVGTGGTQLVLDRDGGPGAWAEDGSILLSGRTIRMFANGSVKPLLKPNPSPNEILQAYPVILPGGRRFLYTSFGDPAENGVYLASIDGTTNEFLVKADSNAAFIAPSTLVFARASDLYVQRLNPRTFRVEGEAVPVGIHVNRGLRSPAAFAASANGLLMYRDIGSLAYVPNWIDRSGKALGTAADARQFVQLALSPDERRVVLQIADPYARLGDLWQLDLSTSVLSRVASEAGASLDPALWSHSGTDVLFSGTAVLGIKRKPVGGGETSTVVKANEKVYPAQELKNGSILFHNQGGRSVWVVHPPFPAQRAPEPLFTTDYNKDAFHVSPDERWVSYSGNETGRWEVYVAAFPSFKERVQVSSNGGAQGLWRKDGKELFYFGLDGSMNSLQIRPGQQRIEASAPQVLFKTRVPVRPTSDQFAVTGDGKRFLILEPAVSDVAPWNVIVNWRPTLRPN